MDTHTLTRGQAWAEYVRATPALSALNAACRFAFLVAYISANPEIFAEINPVAGIVLSRREDSICFHKVLPTCQTVPRGHAQVRAIYFPIIAFRAVIDAADLISSPPPAGLGYPRVAIGFVPAAGAQTEIIRNKSPRSQGIIAETIRGLCEGL